MPKPPRGVFHRRSRSERGQGLVEFALVLPLIMVLLLGVADFGRVFQAGIAEEAAVRDAAEAAAQEYLQFYNGNGNPSATMLATTQYDSLHSLALQVACREADRMPGRVLNGSGNCTMPIIAVCIHDQGLGDGARCGQEAASAPAACNRMIGGWDPTRFSPPDATSPMGGRPYVEVRMCYRFDPLFSFALGSWGTIWLQRENNFVVTNY